jgi:nitric oxide reductase NorD protein
MNADNLKETFYTLVAPDLPNEWDVEEAVDHLRSADPDQCHSILNQVPVIWPVSHSLCFDYLKTAVPALDCIELASLSEWVNKTLDQYEKNGLRAAQRFMSAVEENFLCPVRGESGLRFNEVEGRLLPYLRGLSGRKLNLAPAAEVSTDTSTIYAPAKVNRYPDEADNFFLYKLIVSYQWAFIDRSSFTVSSPFGDLQAQNSCLEELWLEEYLRSFSRYELAADIYHTLETIRITRFLELELPGLMRRKNELFSAAGWKEEDSAMVPAILRDMRSMIFTQGEGPAAAWPEECRKTIDKVVQGGAKAADSVKATAQLYRLLKEEPYTPLEPLVFQGRMDLHAVRRARAARLAELEELFVDGMATRLLALPKTKKRGPAESELIDTEDFRAGSEKPDISIIIDNPGGSSSRSAEKTVLVTINNEEIELGEELHDIAVDIVNEAGYLPARYVSSAVGKAGKGYGAFAAQDAGKGQELAAPVVYNEWDFRRSDFRKNWVSVVEKEVPLIHTSFVDTTLNRFHGEIVRLRYQFEMMRATERFVRRQRDGEDIDLDAVVESMADARAGLAPSDRLFVRLKRDERDIAVLFLIDMSNSTQGWIGRAIKETLVLLCEAMEVVGDRYGIYGFSGMRRLRSEFFHIKHLDEPYDETVRKRIGSLGPREYTRMGPAIRHAVSLMSGVDARIRLMITLSDGKPEDYDDYKGEYAIEDTRHALIEAKAAGIHPFCITIDRKAQEYISHMYGEVNYILIDNVRKLPHKMPEMYRILTR